jgi:hypothetical protein
LGTADVATIEGLSIATQPATLSIPSFLRIASDWFLHSGIQDADGGVARYFRTDLGHNNRVSTEITGYAVSALCSFYRLTSDDAFLDAARRAGDFLTQQAWDPSRGIFPFEWPPTETPTQNRCFFFDSGIIVRGLLTLYRTTRDPRYLTVAMECGRGMALWFDRDGQFAPIVQLPLLDALPYGNGWSSNPGCYQLKSAMAWLELFRETGMTEFSTLWETALQRAMADHAAFLPGTSDRFRVMDRLHAYGYFLEALLAAADRPECRAALAGGIERTADYLRDIAPEFARSDVYAQVLRVRLLADASGAVSLNRARAAEEVAALPAFQYATEDARTNGGFSFGRRDGGLLPFANPVSTAFCSQALLFWEEHQRGTLTATWQDLI